MNLGENLQTLRKKENISQEELAEKLEVSRQAVSKWESGGGYPETEKLLKICEIFNCSLDSLMKGKIEETTNIDLKEYDNFIKKFGKGISIGIFILLIGVTSFLIYLGLMPNINKLTDKETLIGVVILLIFSLIALPLFIINGLEMDSFKKKHKVITNSYSEEEIEKFNKKFAIIITSSISFMLLGVISLLLMYGLKTYKNELMPFGLFMIYITLAVPTLIYYGIQKDKYDINKYNKINDKTLKKSEELIGKISAVIMITVTIIYFILGFIFNLWKYSWLLYPIGGMICGIFAIILNKEDK
jgi:transcriptional regulator with XRE-family HTH domain